MARQRENVLPPAQRVRVVECSARGPQRVSVREGVPQRRRDAVGTWVEQHPRAVVRRHELADPCDVAGDEGDAVLEALVDRVRRVLLERGDDGESPRAAEPSKHLVLIERSLEGEAA